MDRFRTSALLAAFTMLSAGASAQTNLERSGNVFHVAACGAVPAGFARCHAHVVTDAAGNAVQGINGYTPADLRDAYKIKKNGSSSTVVAIVAAYGYNNAESDLGTYRAQWSLPACTTANGCFKKLNQDGQQGNYPSQNLGWAQESALDLDMASAMCPNCQLWLVEANDSAYANLGEAENIAAALGAHAIANSYGGSESGTQSFESAYNHPGIAITVSAGDNGFGRLQFPASSPHVTAVGGTHLERDGSARGWLETAWASSAGGCSAVYPKPKWQHDPDCSRRTLVDVAAVGDPATGVAVYGPISSSQSNWLVFGGTSVGAPLIAGVYGVNGKKVKYASNPYRHTGNLFDITAGGGGNGCNSYLCQAGPGYDGPTGWGTPNGTKAF